MSYYVIDPICYYCSQRTNSLAGNPSEWPIPLCHADEPGVVKSHHIGCVSDRLRDREVLLEVVKKISATNSGGSGARYCRFLADEALEKVHDK